MTAITDRYGLPLRFASDMLQSLLVGLSLPRFPDGAAGAGGGASRRGCGRTHRVLFSGPVVLRPTPSSTCPARTCPARLTDAALTGDARVADST
ncbi:hypothetical protein [Streptomyces sp. S186]|uniref:hypothetical protein n=1 Tax=Streptomyces sp. S186 TaxID=3434395 RepID=UPI003F66B84A